jgi:hypothetical protein
MNLKKIITYLIFAAIAIGLLVLAVNIIRGAVSLAGGLLNTILAIIIILALVAIVAWMLSYAKKSSKK